MTTIVKRKRTETYTLKNLEKDIAETSRRICVQLKEKNEAATASDITRTTAAFTENFAAGYRHHDAQDIPFLNEAIEQAFILEKQLFALLEEAVVNNRIIAKLLLMLDEALELLVLRLELFVSE